MKFETIVPPRQFQVSGAGLTLALYDCAHITLKTNEQVTFLTENKAQYDVTRKEWGFYATPSTNGRLKTFGLRTAIVSNQIGKLYIMIVEKDKESEFFTYINSDKQIFLTWLDDDQSVNKLIRSLRDSDANLS